MFHLATIDAFDKRSTVCQTEAMKRQPEWAAFLPDRNRAEN
jgi:hypothetical protein